MEKKYYNVYYSNVNVEGEPKTTVKECLISDFNGYIIKDYKKELCIQKKKVQTFFGEKTINEKYYVTEPNEKMLTYVEEIDGRYYDIITGIEAIPEIEVYDWEFVQKVGNDYDYHGKKMSKDVVESKKLKICGMRKSSTIELYNFLKNLTSKDIESYRQRMTQALSNIDKVQAQRMSKVSNKASEQKEREEFVRNFIENNGFGKTRTR